MPAKPHAAFTYTEYMLGYWDYPPFLCPVVKFVGECRVLATPTPRSDRRAQPPSHPNKLRTSRLGPMLIPR